MEEVRELVLQETASLGFSKKERSPIVELVRRWGNFTTDAVLDPAIQIFSQPNISGFVGYRRAAGCAVVFGGPICSEEDRSPLILAFHRFAKETDISIVYIGASQSFSNWAVQHVSRAFIEFGEELIFDPSCDPRKRSGTHGSLVRRKVKQAIREGITVHEYLSRDPALELALEQVSMAWLQSRRGTQMHISNVHLFDDRLGKRWFYVKKGDSIVGVVSLNQLQAHNGWLMNHLMTVPKAPNGTSEMLIVSVFETLAREGCRFLTVGIVTPKEFGEIVGLSKFSTWVARTAFKIARKIVDLDGLNTFWEKFHPQKRERSFLLFSRNRIGLSEILGITRALNGSLSGGKHG